MEEEMEAELFRDMIVLRSWPRWVSDHCGCMAVFSFYITNVSYYLPDTLCPCDYSLQSLCCVCRFTNSL